MSRQDANAAFARTSFLYGGNADYIENLYARYEADPAALDGDWQALERSLGDKVKARAQAAGVEFSVAEVQQTTRDSIRALMLIRAYRARGHFYANLDPLGLEPHHNEEDLDPRSYGFSET